jgi:DNA excision repair protein ERCC-8
LNLDSVLTVRWSESRDHLLASGCYAGQVLLWDVRRARSCLQALDLDNISKSSAEKMKGKADTSKKAHCGSTNGLVFCDDGLHLISYGGFEAKLRRWDLTSGRNTKTPFVKLQKRSSSSSSKNKICVKMSLTPSFGRRDGTIFVPEGSNIAAIDVNTGKLHQRLRGHFHGVRCTVFNDRTHELYSGGGDRNILIWDSNPVGPYDEYLKLKGDDDEVSKRQNDNLLQDNWSSNSESDD